MQDMPFADLYRKTPRHPDFKHVLDEIGAALTERALTPSIRELGGFGGGTLGYARKKSKTKSHI